MMAVQTDAVSSAFAYYSVHAGGAITLVLDAPSGSGKLRARTRGATKVQRSCHTVLISVTTGMSPTGDLLVT